MFLLPHLCDIDPKIVYSDKDIIVIDNFYKEYETKRIVEKIDNLPLQKIRDLKWKCPVKCKKLSDIVSTIICNYISIQDWTFGQVNDEWRCIKGEKGYRMFEHFDQPIIKNINEKTFYSILLYLTEDEEGVLIFPELGLTFQPKPGRLIVFNQSLIHKSESCFRDKYFLHSEIFLERCFPIDDEKELLDFELYKKSEEIKDPVEKVKYLEGIFKNNKTLEKMVLNL